MGVSLILDISVFLVSFFDKIIVITLIAYTYWVYYNGASILFCQIYSSK